MATQNQSEYLEKFFPKKRKRKSKICPKKKREGEYVTKYSICANFFPIKIRIIGIY
jgi:hypothetical protein